MHISAFERATLIEMRTNGEINDEVFHHIEHDLDLEEQRFKTS